MVINLDKNMNKYLSFENQVSEMVHNLLRLHSDNLNKKNITHKGLVIKRINTSEENYESEFEISFYKENKFFDIIETHIFRRGKQVASLKEFEIWIEKILKEITKTPK